MNELMAKLVAVATAVLLAATLAAVWISSHPGAGGTTVRAEFDDVYPLLPGMHVRVDGAIAGSVGKIEISDEGTAVVSMELFEGTEPPSADATAAIRQQDITGDSYVALEPGDQPEPLGERAIPTRGTVVAPRFDDLLNSFTEPVRQGLELLLIETRQGTRATRRRSQPRGARAASGARGRRRRARRGALAERRPAQPRGRRGGGLWPGRRALARARGPGRVAGGDVADDGRARAGARRRRGAAAARPRRGRARRWLGWRAWRSTPGRWRGRWRRRRPTWR